MAVEYPPVGFHFEVKFELDGATDNDVRFQEVAGLTAELGVETLQEGGENRFAHRLPGRAKYGNLTLKRGLTTDTALLDWFEAAVEGLAIEPVDVTVSLLNEQHEPLMSWSVTRAWPVKWSVSNFNAQNNAIVVDTLELAYQNFRRL